MYRKNVQGDVTHIYTESGEQVAHYAYDAWGNVQILQDRNEIATINPFRYRSYYFDEESKFYYLQTRYYDPALGRFISADSIEYLDPETIGGLNLYAYCRNNPVTNLDNDGTKERAWWEWLVAGVLIVGIVAAFAVATVLTGGAALAVGGLVGAVIGFGGSVISQGVLNGWDNIDPWQALLDTGLGAISGMLGASGINQIASGICGMGLGFVGSVGSDLIAGQPINIEKALAMMVVGGFIGYRTGAGATNSAALGNLLSQGIEMSGKFSFAAAIGRLMSGGLTKQAIGGNISWTAIQHISNAISDVSFGIAISMIVSFIYDFVRRGK